MEKLYNNVFTPYTCYLPSYYLDGKCDFCFFRPYVKCEVNGYSDEEDGKNKKAKKARKSKNNK